MVDHFDPKMPIPSMTPSGNSLKTELQLYLKTVPMMFQVLPMPTTTPLFATPVTIVAVVMIDCWYVLVFISNCPFQLL